MLVQFLFVLYNKMIATNVNPFLNFSVCVYVHACAHACPC